MIRNIVFDMGNVLLDYDSLIPCLKQAPTEADAKAVRSALFKAPEWEEKLDGCLISEDEMLEIAQSRLQTQALKNLAAQIFSNFHEYALTPKPGMDAVIETLYRRGFGLYLLSNVGERFFSYQHLIPYVDLFDGLLTSGEEKLLKPDPALYHRLCEKFGLNAGECLFIDDRQRNIDGALAAGMQGYLFADGDAKRLAAYLDGLSSPVYHDDLPPSAASYP